MKFELEHLGVKYRGDLDAATSLAIGLDFDGPQPNHFGTAPASRQPLQFGDFVGNTQQGGCCNVDVIELIPHCNGTHTESAGHIVDDDVFVGSILNSGVCSMIPWSSGEVSLVARPTAREDSMRAATTTVAASRCGWPEEGFNPESNMARPMITVTTSYRTGSTFAT